VKREDTCSLKFVLLPNFRQWILNRVVLQKGRLTWFNYLIEDTLTLSLNAFVLCTLDRDCLELINQGMKVPNGLGNEVCPSNNPNCNGAGNNNVPTIRDPQPELERPSGRLDVADTATNVNVPGSR